MGAPPTLDPEHLVVIGGCGHVGLPLARSDSLGMSTPSGTLPTPLNAEPTPSPDSLRLGGIEALRCVAAVMIVVYHTVELPGIAIPSYLNFIKTHFGMGVPLFYTLSGFVLAYGYLDALGSRQQITNFYVRRFFRIAPLFYAMLGVWILYSSLKSDDYSLSVLDLVLNVSLLFGMVPGKHESLVAAGWSIGIEILFYVIFPVLAAVLTSRLRVVAAFCFLSLTSSLAFRALTKTNIGSYAYMNLVTHLPFFLSGVLAYLVWRHDGFKERRLVGNLLVLAVLISAWSIVYVPTVFMFLMSVSAVAADLYAWALLFAVFILSICYSSNPVLVNPVTRYLGKISFSMYLLHPLLIVLLLDVHKALDRALGGDLLGLAGRAALTLTVVSLAASATYALIEKPAMAIGKKLAVRVRA